MDPNAYEEEMERNLHSFNMLCAELEAEGTMEEEGEKDKHQATPEDLHSFNNLCAELEAEGEKEEGGEHQEARLEGQKMQEMTLDEWKRFSDPQHSKRHRWLEHVYEDKDKPWEGNEEVLEVLDMARERLAQVEKKGRNEFAQRNEQQWQSRLRKLLTTASVPG